MKDYVPPRLTVVGTLAELTAASEWGSQSDVPLLTERMPFAIFS